MRDFLRNRKQRVALNGHCLFWADVSAGVPQVSIFGPLLFLVHINDIFDSPKSKCKLFADGTSLFSVVYNNNTSASDLKEDLSNRAFQWKTNFNLYSNELIVHFNNRPVTSTQIHKYPGMMLDTNLSYEHHIKSVLNKVNKTLGLRKFQLMLPRHY